MARGDTSRQGATNAGRPADLRFTVVAGANINSNIAVSGIRREDALNAVLRFVAGVPTSDLVAETSVTSAGNVQLTTTDTTGDKLVLVWYKRRP